MIRKIFITSLLAIGAFLSISADEQRKITLNNNDHNTETIELSYGNIFVSLKEIENNAEVLISVENTHESNTLLLFERAYDEKTLKKMSPSISYDKVFGGSKGKRYIDCCTNLRYTNRIKSSDKAIVLTLSCSENSPTICKLPIYIAKDKNKSGSKMVLLAKDIIELEINVQVKPDEEYEKLSNEFSSLYKEIQSTVFCKNKNHRGESYSKLKNRYESKIKDLKSRIQRTLDRQDSSNRSYKKLIELVRKIDSISITDRAVPACGHDPVTPHSCKNCKMDIDAIYKKLENYYIAIHNGKKTKSQVMSDVESLYTCITKNTKRKGNDAKKSRAIEYYNKIKSLK